MEIKNVKDLKEYLATLPAEADEWEINFIDNEEDGGITVIGNVEIAQWDDKPEEIPEGCNPGDSFLLLSCLPIEE